MPLAVTALSITEITCALSVVSRQRVNVPSATPTIAAEIIRWQPGKTGIRNPAGRTRVRRLQTRILCVLESNFLTGKSRSSRSRSPPRKRLSLSKKKRSVCRPSPPHKAMSVLVSVSPLNDRNLGPGHSRCVGRPNGG